MKRTRLQSIRKSIKYTGLTLYNQFFYGRNAPVPGTVLYINPAVITRECNGYYDSVGLITRKSVKGRDVLISKDIKYRAVKARIQNGTSWEDTGIYEWMENEIRKNGPLDDCYCMRDIIKRYNRLDQLIDQIRTGEKIKTNIELGKVMESDALKVNIDSDATIYKSLSGKHRIAIIHCFGIKIIPVLVGAVSHKALKNGVYNALLSESEKNKVIYEGS